MLSRNIALFDVNDNLHYVSLSRFFDLKELKLFIGSLHSLH